MEAEIPVQVKNSSKSIKNNKQKCDIWMQRKTTATCNNMDTSYKLNMEWRKHDTKEYTQDDFTHVKLSNNELNHT